MKTKLKKAVLKNKKYIGFESSLKMKHINTYFLKGNIKRGDLTQLNQLVSNPSTAANNENYTHNEMPETLPDPGPVDTMKHINTTDNRSGVDS